MFVRLTATDGPTLEEPADCTRFHVEAPAADTEAVGARLGAAGTAAGAPEGHVWVDVAWVRAQAAGRVPEDWPASFDGMLGYAGAKGWLDATGASIQAHVVTPG